MAAGMSAFPARVSTSASAVSTSHFHTLMITADSRDTTYPGVGLVGGQMVVAGLPGHLLQRLRAGGLDGGFTLAPTVDDGAGMFSRTT